MRRPDLIAEAYHGTITNYGYGCRCDHCKAAKAASQRALVERRRGLPEGDPRHGTENGYRNWRCACDACTDANTEALQKWRKARPSLAPDDPRHGTINAYTNYACRCIACTDARRVYDAAHPRGRKFVASRPPALEGDRAAGPPRPAAQPLNDKEST